MTTINWPDGTIIWPGTPIPTPAQTGRGRSIAFASRHFQESATLIVEAAGDYNDAGQFVPGATTESTVTVVTWPLTANEGMLYRDILPGGARISEMRWFCLQEVLAPLRVGTAATNGDKFRYDGLNYTVRAVQPWKPHEFQAALATRDEGQDG